MRPRHVGLAGKPKRAPSTCGVLLQARLRAEVQNKPQTHHRSCFRLGNAYVCSTSYSNTVADSTEVMEKKYFVDMQIRHPNVRQNYSSSSMLPMTLVFCYLASGKFEYVMRTSTKQRLRPRMTLWNGSPCFSASAIP
jgi:hypothetical protein